MSLARFSLRAASALTRVSAPAPVLPGSLGTACVRLLSAAAAPQVVRGKAAAKVEKTDLVSVLTREVAFERQEGNSAASLKEIAAEIPDFVIADEAGTARFSLTRTFGSQRITLDLDCSPVPADDEEEPEFDEEGGAEGEEGEEEEGVTEGYRMLVSITDDAKGKTMQVGAFITDHLRVHRVTLYAAGKAPTADQVFGGFDELPTYSGPAFDELDVALQNAFYDYLAARGVHDELASKLMDYCANKEQSEYVNWLDAVKGFAA